MEKTRPTDRLLSFPSRCQPSGVEGEELKVQQHDTGGESDPACIQHENASLRPSSLVEAALLDGPSFLTISSKPRDVQTSTYLFPHGNRS
jgi:hypothetical protein